MSLIRFGVIQNRILFWRPDGRTAAIDSYLVDVLYNAPPKDRDRTLELGSEGYAGPTQASLAERHLLLAPVLSAWLGFAAGGRKTSGGFPFFSKGPCSLALGIYDEAAIPGPETGKVFTEFEWAVFLNNEHVPWAVCPADERNYVRPGDKDIQLQKLFRGNAQFGPYAFLLDERGLDVPWSVRGVISNPGMTEPFEATVDSTTWDRSLGEVVRSFQESYSDLQGTPTVLYCGAIINGKDHPLAGGSVLTGEYRWGDEEINVTWKTKE